MGRPLPADVRAATPRQAGIVAAGAVAAVAVVAAAAVAAAAPFAGHADALPAAWAAADAAGGDPALERAPTTTTTTTAPPPPPLVQVAGGIDAADVECRQPLVLAIRPSGDPACITERSASRLADRGWSIAGPGAGAGGSGGGSGGGGNAEAGGGEPAGHGGGDGGPDLPRMPGSSASSAYSPGPYAVGVVPNFVRDDSRPFDAWGAEYKSAEYADLLARIAEAGDPSTTATNIYYPSPPSAERVERPHDSDEALGAIRPGPLWAPESGERQTVLGMFMGSGALAAAAGGAHLENRTFGHQSYRGAPPASGDGPFPLVVMVHGLGGGLFTWSQAAEYMASHGYVVVAVAHSSDSGDTPVFEDPSSAFAADAGPRGVAEAYALRSSETGSRVFSNFMEMLYGYDGPVGPGAMPDPESLTARPGGGIEAGAMMGALFEQRVGDVSAVLSEMRALSWPEAECLEAVAPGGGEKEACGLLEGMIDERRTGAMGHSLGSMTAQAALAFVPNVDAAVGFNNGMPKRWEPYGGIPNDMGSDPPAGVPKPIMLVTGSDDAFIHTVFREIHLRWFEAAGGDISETYPLKLEREWPTADNRQPVARSSYERALGAKALVEFADEGHSDAVDDRYELDAPGSSARGLRVALEPGGEQEEYDVLGWVRDDGGLVYLPHQMRNYFATAWFDWLLKEDDAARARIVDHPFGAGVRSMLHEGLEAPPRPDPDNPCGIEGYAMIGDICEPAPEGYVETRSDCEIGVDSREAAGVEQDYQAELEKCRLAEEEEGR